MAWDARRPIPWKRLCIEYVVFAAVMLIVVAVTKRSSLNSGFVVTLVLVSILWIGFGAILAKFGYQRKTLKQMRVEAAMAPPKATSTASRTASTSARNRPAPTSRTSTGPSQRPKKKKR